MGISGLVGVVALSGCADLQHATSGVCGNAVVDSNEDCDGHATAPAACAPAGSAHECRYVCGASTQSSAGGVAVCPTGFGCGFDGVCRESTATFELSSAPVAVSSFVLWPALFDSDGKPIVLDLGDDLGDGRRFARVIDPDGSGSPTGVSIPTPMAHPSIMDLDGDGYQDVAFVDYSGIGVLRGQPSDQASFLAFPSALFAAQSVSLRAIAVQVAQGPHGEDDGDALVVLEDDGETLALRRVDAPDPPLLDLSATGKHAADLSGDVIHAHFDVRSSSPCDQIVIPLQGLSYVPVFAPCSGGTWTAAGSPAVDVSLATSTEGTPTVRGPALVIDVNADQQPDLVVDTDAGAYVAFGRGDGTFAPSADLSGVANTAGPLSLLWEDGQPASADVPIAGGDLNGDGKTDFVFPTGLALDDGTGKLYWAFVSPGWLEAKVGSGQGGAPFVVATSNSVGFDFLVYSADTKQFARTPVPTANIASHLALGDFDGDGVTDVAFVEHSDSLGDTWSVIYGSGAYVPSAPVAMATFDAVLELSPAHLAAPIIGSDAISDLIISANISAASTDTLATSLGSPTRNMIAPFQLREPGGAEVLPIAVTTGRFLSSGPSLAAVAVDDPQGAATLRFWFFSPQSADAADVLMGNALSSSFHSSHFDGNTTVDLRYGAHLATGDFDGDGVDDAVLAAPFGPGDSQSALVVASVKNGAIQTSDPVAFDVQSTLYSVLRVADIDGDGAPDVLFKGLDDDSATFVTVFWNDGKGGFALTQTTSLQVNGGVKDFVCAAGTTPCTLYAVSEDNTFVIDVAADRTMTAREVPSLAGGWSITAGDFDGDGLADLAIGAPTELRLYHAIPRLP